MSNWFKTSDDPLVVLIAAASDDPEMTAALVAVLGQPAFHRRSMLGTWDEHLRLNGAPSAVIAALARLTDDDLAERALALLTSRCT
jgi:hypothetical protein